MFGLKIAILLIVSSIQFWSVTRGIIVTTPLGRIRGTTFQYNGTTVYKFLGIPYAKPPVQDLMLEKPIPIGPWHGTLNATTYGSACVQRGSSSHKNPVKSLDCLYLNVYVPRSLTEIKPVMIFIHGGSYMFGDGSMYDGTALAANGNVTVVVINYRLDAYGFLSTMDNEIPGNYGLWDQRQAMIWVKENIQNFAGDNASLTMFGESAGAYSTGAHMLSTHNVGLFHRVISESGVAVSPIGMTYDPIYYSRKISDYLGCTQFNASGGWDTKAFKQCFKSKDPSLVLDASIKAGDYGVLAYRRIIGPVVDGDFLLDFPRNVLDRDDVPFKNIDLMVGTNAQEGSLTVGPLQAYVKQYNISLPKGVPRQIFKDHIALAIARDYYNDSFDQVLDNITNTYMYSFDGISDFDQAVKMVEMYGDFILQAPTVETVEYHTKLTKMKKTYQYYFTHKPVKRHSLPWLQGANHADELEYVFGPPLKGISDEKIHFSRLVMKYWSNFARYGNPNGEGPDQWPKSNQYTKPYFLLDFNQAAYTKLLRRRVTFWKNLGTQST
ncbi:hypothetical protein LOTGIDRAFT_169331 [Lottia gigantea]|uniref:Carboxylesterase type B domain-containing protein n=1 Tax=Lottia gigantea TaxID=225164 RepID=V4B4V9_LOTGI|nr:hypothetical protein LOTGIDRAFT_169331 [Lottia gigantea]ESO83464.1 hypothetical protein LOTGIDRAFT_169331 [Lottia gigantea]